MRLLKHFLIFLALFVQTVSAQSVANPKVTYFHNDITGTAVAATDEQGEVIWREQRRAYGEIKVDPLKPRSLDEFSVGYTGHQADKESGLTYAKARYYNKAIGRFYAPDPIPFRESDLTSFNRYVYAANNPYMFVDPTGMEGELTEEQKRIIAEKKANEAMILAEMGGEYFEKKKDYVEESQEAVEKGTEVVQTTFETVVGLIGGVKPSVGATTKATTKASKSAIEGATKVRKSLGNDVFSFARGSRNFKLIQGNAKSGWKHIYDRHIDPNRFVKKSKFNDLAEDKILSLLSRTIKHGKESSHEGLSVFTKRLKVDGRYKNYRATINKDNTVRTFHPLD